MMPVGTIWKNVQEATRLYSTDSQDSVRDRVNAAYYRLCGMLDWQPLRRSISITTDGTATGTLLPADLVNVLAVRDSDGYEYTPTETQDAGTEQQDWRRCWAFEQSAVAPLYAGKSITIGKDTATFTASPAVSAAMVGEYMRIATDPGFYKISAVNAITTTYRGPSIEGKVYVVRPPTTRRILVYGADGQLEAGTFTAHYWAYPEPLHQEWQVPLIAAFRAIELLTLIDILGTQEKQEKIADNYRQELQMELSAAKARNPKVITPKKPMGRDGVRLSFGWRG